MTCKTSTDCPDKHVCDAKTKECRDDKREKTIDYYKTLCKKKGIPLVFELGPKKGEPKPKEALKRCLNQKARKDESIKSKTKTPSPIPCKMSKDCPGIMICDAKTKLCRENKREKPAEYYLEAAKKKGVAMKYVLGKKAGEEKPLEAIKRTLYAKK